MNNLSHFSEEEIAMCADSINNGNYHQLPESYRNHLSNCEQCASEVLMVADIAFDFNTIHQKSKFIHLKKWVLLTSLTTAAAIIIIAVYKLIPLNQNDSLHNELVSRSDTFNKTNIRHDSMINVVPNESNKNLMASMEPNDKLEKLFKNHQESYRVNSIQIITKGELPYSKEDSLKWINVTNEMLTVEIFNNRDEAIKTIKTNQSAIKTPKLNTGLYYWKLINEDYDLLYVGKIIVK